MTKEEVYAQTLLAFEIEQHRRGKRPPLGTRWPAPSSIADAIDARRRWIRRNKVEELLAKGYGARRIAREVGVPVETVYNDIAVLRRGK